MEDINHLTGLIPSGDGVHVVATTTNKVGWEDQGWNSIKVGVFDRSESINYLLTVTKSDDRDAADALAERLGDLPSRPLPRPLQPHVTKTCHWPGISSD